MIKKSKKIIASENIADAKYDFVEAFSMQLEDEDIDWMQDLSLMLAVNTFHQLSMLI